MKLIVFDLDGTLIDSAEDIARSVNEMLQTRGRAPLPHDRIRSYVGDGVRKLMERSLGEAGPSEIESASESYLAIYRRRLLETTRAYPGVEETLDELGHRALSLAVLTNKPLRESEAILEGLGLARHFRSVCGGDSFERKKPDPMGVFFLMDRARARPEETLLVGDSVVDLRTARNAGVGSCLVSYGFAPLPDFEKPDFVVDNLKELLQRI
jgi:phosphoglycolate phosphatase